MKRRAQAEVGYIAEDGWVSKHWGNIDENTFTPLQAIKMQCLECQGGHENPWQMADGKVQNRYRPFDLVRECCSPHCFLFPFRMGRQPSRKGKGGNVEALERHRESKRRTGETG